MVLKKTQKKEVVLTKILRMNKWYKIGVPKDVRINHKIKPNEEIIVRFIGKVIKKIKQKIQKF